jgi:transcriptional regulator with XRE-family HTH domain
MTDKEKTTKEKKHLLRERVAKEFAAERMMQQISQEELAERIGTKKSGISRLECGAQNMSVDYIELLAEALHKNVSFVMEDIGPDYGKSTVYELKLYDEPLVRFRLSRGDALPKSGVL